MKKCLLLGAGLAGLAHTVPVSAQENEENVCYIVGGEQGEEQLLCYPGKRILVSGSRSGAVRLQDFTGAGTVLETETLEQRQVRDVADILRDTPGVAVTSTPGQTQLRLRGAEANHVMVLVDGIEVSDPFAGEFDMGTLQAEIGSRIEVVRGPQSALYGSDAIGGVVSYQTAPGYVASGLRAFVEAGTNGRLNGSARAGLGDAVRNLALSATVVSTDGEPNARGGARNIGRDSYTLSANGGIEASDILHLRAVGRFTRTTGDYNDQDYDPSSPTFGMVIDTPGVRYENDALYALVGARLATMDDRWTHDLSAQVADIRRDTFGPFGRTSGNDGQRLKASYVSAFAFGEGPERHSLTFAAEWEKERYRNDDPYGSAFSDWRSIENTGLAAEYLFASDSIDFSLAVRHDINSRFADETTYRIGGGYDLSAGTRIRASYGSGIKNPGFFELFGYFDGQFIGNADLKPEKSEGWEVGLDQKLLDGAVQLSATWFDSELKDEIYTTYPAPDYVATPANRDSVSSRKGLELSGKAKLASNITLDLAYTWLDAKEDGVEEVRRPGNIASAILGWVAPDDAASATLIVRHNGATDDLAFTDPSYIPVIERLDAFTLVNLAGEARLNDRLRLFGRIENLFDERYEQVFSFVSPGRQVVAGIRAEF
ncbi:TonB-dependent receptor [Altererythrobacter epoxidivorans]|uniref:TonB-dependent receptor n=1 Tax=Altererythrobacter epoxidivorans TaxID=361183 RepID=A0A0M4MWJ5_9SPHN|nr:TonB-dependent receptor [Altererythrobacter epoxidivorans]ALE17138.1 TonB-dependent receptor [Altererythrobacter epoxidivorans]